MSYDVSLVINTGKQMHEVVEVGNYTYNVGPMFYKALGVGLGDLEGVVASEAIPRLRAAVADMVDNPVPYEAMNPSNGWGDYAGALRYLRKLLECCEENPLCTIHVC